MSDPSRAAGGAVAVGHHASTRAVTSGRTPDGSSLAPVLWPSSTFHSPTITEASKRGRTPRSTDFYSRLGNPTVQAFADAVADLEGAEAGVAFSSGMGAISSVVMAMCRQGGHVVAQRQLFTSTSLLFQLVLPRFGVEVTLVDVTDTAAMVDAVRPGETQVLFVETPANPTMEVADLAVLGAVAGPLKVVDSTFGTPLLQRPVEFGFDVVIHSATKALSGHNDATLGVAVGDEDVIDQIWGYSAIHGACASPFDAWNGIRGLRTLGVRIERQTASAGEIAARLQAMPGVASVLYPGLASHPQRGIVKAQMDGAGGCLSLRLEGGRLEAMRFVDALELIRVAPSLGGPETLVNHPASMTHAQLPAEDREELGITESMLRLSIGLEHVDDIWSDIERALMCSEAVGTADDHVASA